MRDLHDVANDEVMYWNRCRCSVCAPVNDHFLAVDLVLELQHLALLDVVAGGTEEAGEHESDVDGERLDEAVVVLILAEE